MWQLRAVCSWITARLPRKPSDLLPRYPLVFAAAIVVALILRCSVPSEAKAIPSLPDLKGFLLGETIDVGFHGCFDSWRCTFYATNIKGVLGQNLDVAVMGYEGPSMRFGSCPRERKHGREATRALWNILRGATKIQLVRAHKHGRNPIIHSRVKVDGTDVAELLIAQGLVAPPGLEVDFCAWDGQEVEVRYGF